MELHQIFRVAPVAVTSFSHRLTAYKFVGISLDCNIWICLGIIRSKIAFFRISNISVPYLYAQLRGRTVIKKLRSFFVQGSRSLLVTAMLNFSVKATLFNFSVLDQKKSKKIMREGGKKKDLRKKNIEPIFKKGNEGDEIKNFRPI